MHNVMTKYGYGNLEIIQMQYGMQEGKMKEYQWVCKVCGYVYDGTVPFEDLPDDYVCPVCGVGKAEFEKVEVKEK